ncbi:MAG: tetratricopeptide repeat protein [Myxococcota bacterium]
MRRALAAAAIGLSLALSGCGAGRPAKPRLAYDPVDFGATLRTRVPELDGPLSRAPFEVDAAIVERARRVVMAAPRGQDRVRALVDFLSAPAPDGLGLVYDWSVTATAERTLELGRGNCFALASVLVGLGRGLDWPIYYAEARPRRPETHEFEAVTAVSDHMVVLVVAKTVRMIIDFTGLVESGSEIQLIDDLTAYAHLVNNVSGQHVMATDRPIGEADWQAARDGFLLATRIAPELGRAWNNLGIAYARLGHFDEARAAYARALELGTVFGSAERNLSLMETRANGAPSLLESRLPE